MPRILAIDWDRHEVRAVLLSASATGLVVDGAWVSSISRGEGAALGGKQIGERLAAVMGERLGGKLTTLVAMGRDNVQMQLLTLPPAPLIELPDMVRFQAEREFTALSSEAALDYIPISGGTDATHQVLAVALMPAGTIEARAACEALGLIPDRIGLRACAAAAFVYRSRIVDADSLSLIVNPLIDEADLTVQAGDRVMLMRTVRLPVEALADARQRALLGEIRRTMAAVRQQLADRKVDQVIVCGSEVGERGGGLAGELEVPVKIFDPVEHAPSGFDATDLTRENRERFTAVLGLALSEADRRSPIIDFVNVRRRTEVRRFNRVHALAATVAALLVLFVGARMWKQLAEPAQQLAMIESRIQELQIQVDMYKSATTQASAIERWMATDVNWLDELEQFARRVRPQPLSADSFPVDDDVVLTQLRMLRQPGPGAVGGRMDVQAKAKSDAAVRTLEQRLSDEHHRVTPGGVQQDTTVAGYPRSLDLQIDVLPTSDEMAGEAGS